MVQRGWLLRHEITIAQVREDLWSVVVLDPRLGYLDPFMELVPSLEAAKAQGCRMAAAAARVPVDDVADLVRDVVWSGVA
jgi:hypothetical protein